MKRVILRGNALKEGPHKGGVRHDLDPLFCNYSKEEEPLNYVEPLQVSVVASREHKGQTQLIRDHHHM